MSVPNPAKPLPEDHGFPAKQLLTLAICRFAEPIAFVSIISYTYVMVQTFPGITSITASFYAGLLISAFAVAEACTAMLWGSISDRYGRKPIILVGLAGTALSSLAFGFAKNFWVAFAARTVGGLLNGNIAVMQTMVSEIAYRPEYEPKAYAMPPFMWSFGAIIGAAMGGYLAEPARYYPLLFSQNGLFGQYPYLLPNLVAVVAIILAIIQGYFFLKETNPRFQSSPRQGQNESAGSADERTPLFETERRGSAAAVNGVRRRPSLMSGSMPIPSDPSFDLRRSSIVSIHNSELPKFTGEHLENAIEDDDPSENPPPIKAFTRPVLLWITAITIMCYHQMAFASLLPTYFLDLPSNNDNKNNNTTTSPPLDLHGGLGYTVHTVGFFMSINGIISLLIQALIFPPFVSYFGVWKSLVWLIILCPITYILIPFVSLLPRSSLPYGVYALMALQNFFMIIIYPCLLIALKNATTSSLVLGRVNGLAMSACSGARTVAPPLEGWIYGISGSGVAWWSIAAVALIGVAQLCFLPRSKDNTDVPVKSGSAERECGNAAVTD